MASYYSKIYINYCINLIKFDIYMSENIFMAFDVLERSEYEYTWKCWRWAEIPVSDGSHTIFKWSLEAVSVKMDATLEKAENSECGGEVVPEATIYHRM